MIKIIEKEQEIYKKRHRRTRILCITRKTGDSFNGCKKQTKLEVESTIS